MSDVRVPASLTPAQGYVGVPCPTCNARHRERCVKGGMSWPEPAPRPHKRRRQDALIAAWFYNFGDKGNS